jgi:CubicO group peptidase (beta-lactamase class C family)
LLKAWVAVVNPGGNNSNQRHIQRVALLSFYFYLQLLYFNLASLIAWPSQTGVIDWRNVKYHALAMPSRCGSCSRDSHQLASACRYRFIMTSKFFFIPITFLLACFSFSLSAQKSDDHKQEIDNYLKTEMKVEQIPGLSYAVVSNGKIIDSGAYGWANTELKAPVTSHTLFNIGSIGKTFTATAIMLLQKDGKLSIEDPINKYLDSLPESWKNITIKNLLTHTSGIKDYAHDFPGYPFIEKDRKQEITEAQFIRMATNLPLNFQPGERWAYSNSNFVLLGFIIHKVSGKFFGDFVKERIFEPAGMKETRYTDVREIIPNRASGYLLDEDDNNKLINGLYVSNFFSRMGDMGILTTATDLARWCIAQDRASVLDKQILQMMWQPSKLNNGFEAMGLVGSNYGMGWFIGNHRGTKEIGHSGSFINGYTAMLSRFPEKNFDVVVLTNLNPTSVGMIGYNIAGFFMSELKGIDRLQPEKSADTSFTERAQSFLQSIGTGNYDYSLVSETFIQRLNPITKMIFGGPQPKLSFITSDEIRGSLERYGVKMKKISYYKIQVENETHYLAFYLSVDNKIADMRGY